MKVRLNPNETYYDDAPNFKWEDFKVSSIFDDVVFGWWIDTYIEVSRKDYDENKLKIFKGRGLSSRGSGPTSEKFLENQ